MNKKIKSVFSIGICAFFALAILINPEGSMAAAKSSLMTCANSVIPSLFPFFVCSRMLVQLGTAKYLSKLLSPVMKPVFGVGGGGSLAFILGIISGYPVGAKTAADLVEEGICTPSEGEKLLAYCNNSGPLFILGAVGSGMLGNPEIGLILYAAHFLSSLSIAILMRNIPCEISKARKSKETIKNKHFGEILTDAIGGGAESVFAICGFVIIFNILITSLEHFGIIRMLSLSGINYNICKTVVCGLFEPTGGCMQAAEAFKNNPAVLYTVLSAILGWSGISVHLQVLGIIKKKGLSTKYYFWGKIGMSLISPVYTCILINMFPQFTAADVFAPAVSYNLPGVYASSLIYVVVSVAAAALFAVLSGTAMKKRTIE